MLTVNEIFHSIQGESTFAEEYTELALRALHTVYGLDGE